MRYLKTFLLLTFTLLFSKSIAQKTNSEKILGCWSLKKMEFNANYDFAEELIKESKNSVVCFDSNGKFKTTKPGTSPITTNGSYKILLDGKKITQRRDLSDGNGEENAEIEFLDDKQLVLKLEIGFMYFERN